MFNGKLKSVQKGWNELLVAQTTVKRHETNKTS